MAVTNLTNTTWCFFPSSYTATSGYGQFKINGNISGVVLSGNITEFYVGYGLSSNQLVAQGNSIAYLLINDEGVTQLGGVGTLLTPFLTITGGDDVESPELISWLETNGTQLKVTDLTNTTWYVPSAWTARAGYGRFSITGTYITDSTSEGSFNSFSIGYLFDGPDEMAIDSYVAFDTYGIDINRQFSLTITGGTDTANPKLLAWFSKWGELQGAEEPETINLAGTSWSVENWSASEGLCYLNMDCSIYVANTKQTLIPNNATERDLLYLGAKYYADDNSYRATENYISGKLEDGTRFELTPSDTFILTINANPNETYSSENAKEVLANWLNTYGKLITKSYDLNQLNLDEGAYLINIIAKAEGYNSAYSIARTYTVEPSTPVWNGTDLTGTTWLINVGGENYSNFPSDTIDLTNIEGYFHSNKSNSSVSPIVQYELTRVYMYGSGIQFKYENATYNKAEMALYNDRNYISFNRQTSSSYKSYNSNNTNLTADDLTLLRTVSFTGGNDCTNPTLISCMKANAILTSHTMA